MGFRARNNLGLMFIYKHTPRRTRLGDLCPSPPPPSPPLFLTPSLHILPRTSPVLRVPAVVGLLFHNNPNPSTFSSSSCRFRSLFPQRDLLFPVSVCNSPAQSLKQILTQAPLLHHVKKNPKQNATLTGPSQCAAASPISQFHPAKQRSPGS